MEKKNRTWLSLLLAVLLVAGVFGVAVIGGAAYFFFSRVRSEPVAEQTATERLEEQRRRFAGQQALVEIRNHDEIVVHRRDPPRAGGDLRSLKALVYDANDNRLVEANLPFWLVRLMPGGRISMATDEGTQIDTERLGLTVKDLEAFGPGLIVDHRDREGAHILIWTE